MSLLLLVLIALLVAVVYLVVRMNRSRDAGASLDTSARRTLDERFARGEIEPDDYRARRELLDRERLA